MGGGAERRWVPGVWGQRGQFLTPDAHEANSDSKRTAFGVDRHVGKEMRLLATCAKVSNAAAAALTPWRQARSTDQMDLNGLSAAGISIAMHCGC